MEVRDSLVSRSAVMINMLPASAIRLKDYLYEICSLALYLQFELQFFLVLYMWVIDHGIKYIQSSTKPVRIQFQGGCQAVSISNNT